MHGDCVTILSRNVLKNATWCRFYFVLRIQVTRSVLSIFFASHMMKILAVIIVFQISVALAVSPLVDLSYTAYRGVPLANGVTQWLGMRYASPPLGELRFRAPIDPSSNNTVQQADAVCLSLRGSRLYSNSSSAWICLSGYWSGFPDSR